MLVAEGKAQVGLVPLSCKKPASLMLWLSLITAIAAGLADDLKAEWRPLGFTNDSWGDATGVYRLGA